MGTLTISKTNKTDRKTATACDGCPHNKDAIYTFQNLSFEKAASWEKFHETRLVPRNENIKGI